MRVGIFTKKTLLVNKKFASADSFKSTLITLCYLIKKLKIRLFHIIFVLPKEIKLFCLLLIILIIPNYDYCDATSITNLISYSEHVPFC